MKIRYCESCANKYGLPGATVILEKQEVLDGVGGVKIEIVRRFLPLSNPLEFNSIGGYCYICGYAGFYAGGQVNTSDKRLKGVEIFYLKHVKKTKNKG